MLNKLSSHIRSNSFNRDQSQTSNQMMDITIQANLVHWFSNNITRPYCNNTVLSLSNIPDLRRFLNRVPRIQSVPVFSSETLNSIFLRHQRRHSKIDDLRTRCIRQIQAGRMDRFSRLINPNQTSQVIQMDSQTLAVATALLIQSRISSLTLVKEQLAC